MDMMAQLHNELVQLRLSGMRAHLEARNREAVEGQLSYVEFLAMLLEDEREAREERQLHTRLKRAKVNNTKTLETYDFSFNPHLNRQQVLQLASCEFIRKKRNLLICGPAGVGKSHLAQAITHAACRLGFRALYVSTQGMLRHLHGGRADDTLRKRFQIYLRPDLLVLDDFGLKPLTSSMPEDLYDVINGRYEQGSIVLTSNRSPTEWPDLFGDPLLASAGLDRLADQAEILVIQGKSYRARGRRQLITKEVVLDLN